MIAAFMAAQLAGTAPVDDTAACRQGGGPAVLIEVVGMKDARGALRLELYPATKDGFLADDVVLLRSGRTFRRTELRPAPYPSGRLCLRVPSPGSYALALLHDRDGDGKFSVLRDGVGFPANRPLGRSRPTVEDGHVVVGGGVLRIRIVVNYLRGLGFRPLRAEP